MAALRVYLGSHLLAVVAEWASLIGLLVAVHERSGPTATGMAAIATLAPHVLLASTTVRLSTRFQPASVRSVSLAAQAGGYGLAAVATAAGWPIPVAVLGVAVAFTGVTVLRPIGAVLLPALARTSRELTTANVRVGHCEGASVLVGPFVAAGLLAVGGGSAVLAGCTAIGTVATLASVIGVRHGPAARVRSERAPSPPSSARLRAALLRPVSDLLVVVRSPAGAGAVSAAIAQYMLIGALDIIIVIVAAEHVDLGDAGVGILTAAFGAGAVASMAVSHRLVCRPRLAPSIVVALGLIGVGTVALGVSLAAVTALLLLPVLGCSRSLVDVLSRVLLQRSAPPSELARVFGVLETGSGIGMLAGTVLAQVLIALGDARTALVGVGVAYLLLLPVLIRPLRSADDHADVPVVAMAHLSRLAAFEPLPTPMLEAVARTASEVPVESGQVLIRQGEPGDRFYAVCDGTFDVAVSGSHVRRLGPGAGFGEVALLAEVPRTATVTALDAGALLAIDREPFLMAITGVDSSLRAAWESVQSLVYDDEAPHPPPDGSPAAAGSSG